ncbi:unnamed protein product, partial [Ectocarpus sp. 12 AP-2014]
GVVLLDCFFCAHAMMPSDAADAVDARQSMPGEGLRGSGVQTQPGGDGRLASASFDPVNEGGLQQTAATNDVRRGDEISTQVSVTATPPRPSSSKEESVEFTIDFVELASNSSMVAKTLYRTDEAAYRAACGRSHVLFAKKRKRPQRVPMDPGCMAMMDYGRGMKVQRRGILEKLRAEEARQEYIKIELGVAGDKIGARARR